MRATVKPSLPELAKSRWEGETDARHGYTEENKPRLYAVEMAALMPSGGVLLDVGCGACETTVHLAKNFNRIIAFDPSQSMLDAGKQRVAKAGVANIVLTSGDAARFPTETNSADAILMYGVIQDLDDAILIRHFEECDRVLKPGGVLVWGLVPDKNLRWLWYVGPLRNPRPSRTNMLRNLKNAFWNARRAKAKGDIYWDGIGRWFTRDELSVMAETAGYEIDFFHSWFFSYRFHALLRRKCDVGSSHALHREP